MVGFRAIQGESNDNDILLAKKDNRSPFSTREDKEVLMAVGEATTEGSLDFRQNGEYIGVCELITNQCLKLRSNNGFKLATYNLNHAIEV